MSVLKKIKKIVLTTLPLALIAAGVTTYFVLKNNNLENSVFKDFLKSKNLVFDVVKTSHSDLPGNRNVPTWKTLNDWGIEESELFFEENVVFDQEPSISFINYDFTEDHVNALLSYYSDGKKYEKEIIIKGFAPPKVSLEDLNKRFIISHEFKYVVLPPDFELPSSLEEISVDAFAFAEIPPSFNLKGLTKLSVIKDGAFSNSKLPWNFEIPDTVSKIGKGVFRNTKLPVGWKNPKIWKNELPFKSYWGAILPTNFSSLINSIETFKNSCLRNTVLPPDFQLPIYTKALIGNPFNGAVLPSNFIPKSYHTNTFAELTDRIAVGGYAGATFADGFTMGKMNNLKKISKSSFRGSFFPIGFALPSTVTCEPNAFFGAQIPFNARWETPNHSFDFPTATSKVVAK